METVAAIPKYNLTEEQEKRLILREYRALLRSLKPKLKAGDKEHVRDAFEMAAEAHKTMRRKSGEPYILHPLAVSQICVEEIGLGVRSTICALLHDVVALVRAEGWSIGNVDTTVVLEAPRLAPHKAAMEEHLAAVVGAAVSVKAKRAEGLGALGRGEGVACFAVALLLR